MSPPTPHPQFIVHPLNLQQYLWEMQHNFLEKMENSFTESQCNFFE